MSIQLGWVFVGLCILWVTPWILALIAIAIAVDARNKANYVLNVTNIHASNINHQADYLSRQLARCIKWPKWGGG
jgi:cytochrome c-type biogenesis protein CcmH/NrfF